MQDLVRIELYRDERWLPWDYLALRDGDMWRVVNGPNAGLVMRAMSDAPNDYGDCIAANLVMH